jgi:hypothetical protein
VAAQDLTAFNKQALEDAMEQMEVRHYLTFEFPGLDDKFVYIVSEDTKNGVQQELLNRSWELEGPVIEFEEISGRKIAVNALYVCRCQALFDAGIFPAKGDDESRADMIIAIEGMSKPLYYNDIDAADAALIASVMAESDESACSFVSFTDEDGEANFIPADRVMLLESVHYDDEYDEEVGENGQD